MSDELPPQTRREAREAERRRALADAAARAAETPVAPPAVPPALVEPEPPPATGLTEIPTELITPPERAALGPAEPEPAEPAPTEAEPAEPTGPTPAPAPVALPARLRAVADGGAAGLRAGTAGLAEFARRHPLGVRIGAGAAVFLLLATGSLLTGMAVGRAGERPAATAAPVEEAADRTAPSTPAAASRLRTCSVASLLAPEAVGTLSASVVDAVSGEVLLDRAGATAVAQGTGLQLVTAASALAALGPDYRLQTRVVDAGDGAIALVGAGDATLSALPAGQESVYPGAPKLSDLATQTLIAYSAGDGQISRIVLDAGYWSSTDAWNSGWDRGLQTGGVLSLVTALQVDGDRADPTAAVSPRSDDPISAAGAKFLAALRAADTAGILAPDVEVTAGTAPTGARTLGSVNSQPVGALIGQMLSLGDATLAEMLARVASKVGGSDGSAASLTSATVAALGSYDPEPADLSITDGSGHSAASTVPPAYLAQLMAAIQSGEQNLDEISGGLVAIDADGAVSAARGSGAGVYSLNGIISAGDGTLLTFSFSAGGAGVPDSAPAALDALATAVAACGDNLSTN